MYCTSTCFYSLNALGLDLQSRILEEKSFEVMYIPTILYDRNVHELDWRRIVKSIFSLSILCSRRRRPMRPL